MRISLFLCIHQSNLVSVLQKKNGGTTINTVNEIYYIIPMFQKKKNVDFKITIQELLSVNYVGYTRMG